ncbi:histamine H2 receptor isoform X1 [Nematostella vectensis]|nr:histamine H2 receptor isoform X1 [Nematostella vectensis]XP_048581477.1 histamine H2 receptor isoform X1 [Nematostella vectensis]
MVAMNNSNATEPSRDVAVFELWYWVLRAIITLLTIVGNAVVILLILCCPRLRITPNVFICTLAIADILVGIVITPSEFACAFVYPGACEGPKQHLTYDILIHLSVTNLCALTFDRYTAIVNPLRYQSHLIRKGHSRRVAVILFIAWISAAIFPVLGFLFRHRVSVASIFRILDMAFLLVLPPILLLLSYLRMVYIARRHERKIKLQEFQLSFNYSNENLSKARDNKVESRERATVKMIGAVIVVFLVCYGLAVFRSLYGYIMRRSIPMEVQYLSRLLLLANSAFNFVVYAFLKKDFKDALRRMCRRASRDVRKSYRALKYRQKRKKNKKSVTTQTEDPV